MSDWDVLRAAAEEVGLDADEMQQETESGKYGPMVERHIREAHGKGITGVPAYVIDERYLIMGAQPYELFQQVMAKLEEDE